MRRGEIWWADLGVPLGSAPGYRRPVLIISKDIFNDSRISTVIVAVVTSNLKLALAPGNVRVSVRDTGLSAESVVNVSQLLTVDKGRMQQRVGQLDATKFGEVEDGLRTMMGL